MAEANITSPSAVEVPAHQSLGLVATLGVTFLSLLVMTGGFYHDIGRLFASSPPTVTNPPPLLVWELLKIAGLAVVVLAVWYTGRPLRDYLKLTWRAWFAGLGILVGFFTFLIQFGVILTWLYRYGVAPAGGLVRYAEALVHHDFAVLAITVWLGWAVVVPIVDEIVFRGFMYRGLAESRLGPTGAIVLTSLAFGLAYKVGGAGWDWVAMKAIVGLVFGWMRWQTDSVGASMAAHIFMNIMVAACLTHLAAQSQAIM